LAELREGALALPPIKAPTAASGWGDPIFRPDRSEVRR
jgi:hypothetical protein